MKYFFLSFIFLLLMNNTIFAQDTIQVSPDSFSKGLAKQFSQTRILDIQYSFHGSRDVSTKYLGDNLGTKHIESTENLRISINLPIITKDRWRLTFSGNYSHQNTKYSSQETQNFDEELHHFYSAMSYTYFSSLFKKPIIYNSSLIVEASGQGFERVKGLLSAIMVLKRGKNMNMSIGLVGLIDPTVTIPILPTFTYSKSIFNNKWTLDAIIPAHIMLRTRLGETGRISFGTEIESTSFFFNSNEIVSYTDDFEFRQIGLKSGATYEYLLKNKFVLTAKAGLLNVFQSRVTEKGKRFNKDNYLIEYDPKATGYFNLGISFNPF